MADKKGFDADVMLKNLTKTIKEYGSVMGERSKIQADLITNQLKLSQNWLWKLKAQQASPEYQYQQMLKQQFLRQQGTGANAVTPETDVFAEEVQPQVRMGKSAYEMHYPSQKQWIYSRIQQKKQKNIPLTEKEQKFEEESLGIKETKPSWVQQREADIEKKKALEVLNRGTWYSEEKNKTVPFSDKQDVTDYIIENFDKVDITDPDIQQALAQYKPAEEEIDEPSWFERVFQGQKYPQKRVKGYLWEQRDGKWYKVKE